MSHKIDLPDSNWAVIRDDDEMTPRLRKPMERAQAAVTRQMLEKIAGSGELGQALGTMGFTPEEHDALWAAQIARVIAYLEEWSLGDLPTAETLEDTPDPIYKALCVATRMDQGGEPSPTDPGDSKSKADPADPTGRGTSSKGNSKAPTPRSRRPSG